MTVNSKPAPDPDPTQHPRESPRDWWALGVLGLAQLMIVLDATIVNIALPWAQRDLAMSDGDRSWAITAYTLAFGGLLLLGGRIGDRYGHRRAFLVGLIGFALASLLGGSAATSAMLFGARALQGVFAALLAPAALTLLNQTFTRPAARATAFGVYGALSSGGAALGLLAGGALVQTLDWRWCLYVNVPIALLAVLGARLLRRDRLPATRPRIDLRGAVLGCGGMVALVYAFATAEGLGWAAPIVLVCAALGLVLVVAFGWSQARARQPLLRPGIVLDRTRSGALLAVLLSQVALFGVFLFLTYYLQEVLGFAPIVAGAAFLPLTAATVLGATVLGSRLLPRVGPRPLIVTGLVLLGIGIAVLAGIGTAGDAVFWTHLLPAQLCIGLGQGLVMMPAMAAATMGVDSAEGGIASAAVNTAQQLGGSLGTALLNTVAASAAAAYLTHADAPARTSDAATVHGFVVALWVALGVLVAAAALAWLVLPRRRTPADEPTRTGTDAT